jgi:hypothetical protein
MLPGSNRTMIGSRLLLQPLTEGSTMKYGRIMPETKTFDIIEADDFQEAKRMCGLDPNQVDHGLVWRGPEGGVSIVVYEYGLFEPARTDYFVLERHLYVGSALLYQHDRGGETVDYDGPTAGVRWLNSPAEVEQAIKDDLVVRPENWLNDKLVWSWPNPQRPFGGK